MFSDIDSTDTNTDTNKKKKARADWERLIGKEEFHSISEELQDWLIESAGSIELGYPVDLEPIYQIVCPFEPYGEDSV